MKKIFLVLIISLFCLPFTVLAEEMESQKAEAELKKINYEERQIEDQTIRTLKIEAVGTTDPIKGKTIAFEQNLAPSISPDLYRVGDKVFVNITTRNGVTDYAVIDFIRTENQIFLFVIFFIILAVIGGFKGVRSVFGLFLSLLIIIFFIIPNIVNGADAFLISIIGAAIILIPTVFFVHGFNKKSTVSIIGCLLSLVIAAILSIIFSHTGKITGIGNEDILYLIVGGNLKINAQALFLAGIIIGTLGVLIDMTIGQASAVQEINEANPTLSFKELYQSGMNVGKDHIGSLVNTLFLAYAGSALPILISFSQSKESFSFLLSMESTANEVLRAFIGSIALIVAVPITTFIGAYWVKKQNSKEQSQAKL